LVAANLDGGCEHGVGHGDQDWLSELSGLNGALEGRGQRLPRRVLRDELREPVDASVAVSELRAPARRSHEGGRG
jgi:hypothetical protein